MKCFFFLLQILLRLIGPEVIHFGLHSIIAATSSALRGGNAGTGGKVASICAIFEDTLQRCKSIPPPLSGIELARMMRVGTRVVRGIDWKWGDQDGPNPSEGRVIGESLEPSTKIFTSVNMKVHVYIMLVFL